MLKAQLGLRGAGGLTEDDYTNAVRWIGADSGSWAYSVPHDG